MYNSTNLMYIEHSYNTLVLNPQIFGGLPGLLHYHMKIPMFTRPGLFNPISHEGRLDISGTPSSPNVNPQIRDTGC